ncbi:TPA: DeoR/GlpR transcriptional regulator [Pseudomonas putida]|nr:DeoR/GlpR transcriptional regulator [Pseudomonas putida]
MLNQERKDQIRARLSLDGRVIAAELAKEFGVSEDAIRRDLRELARMGYCRRVYGGALLPAPDFGGIQERTTELIDSKNQLAKSVANHVTDGATIFIDASSTNIAVAAELPKNIKITVITNAPAIAVALTDHVLCKIIVLGGTFNPIKGACLGSLAVEEAKKIYADILILGACGVDRTLGITAFDPEEAEFKRCLINQSSLVIAPITSNKVGTVAPFKLCEASDIDILMVEDNVPPSTIENFKEIGIKVEISEKNLNDRLIIANSKSL